MINVCPNDSAHYFLSVFRPCADEASREKERLEEKQRAARKERSKNEEEWSTRWGNACTCMTYIVVSSVSCWSALKYQVLLQRGDI